jgi:hypothetical protein
MNKRKASRPGGAPSHATHTKRPPRCPVEISPRNKNGLNLGRTDKRSLIVIDRNCERCGRRFSGRSNRQAMQPVSGGTAGREVGSCGDERVGPAYLRSVRRVVHAAERAAAVP